MLEGDFPWAKKKTVATPKLETSVELTLTAQSDGHPPGCCDNRCHLLLRLLVDGQELVWERGDGFFAVLGLAQPQVHLQFGEDLAGGTSRRLRVTIRGRSLIHLID